MKNRDYKNFVKGSVFHIYNRGNNKEKIFYDEQDYKAFLFRLGLNLGLSQEELGKNILLSLPYSRIRITGTSKKDFKLHSFCLMPNHFHLLIEQTGDNSVSKLISKLCTSYAKYFNKKYKRVGHVFQDQFKSVLIENNPQLLWISSYIHMNPVKDGFRKHPGDYLWSSYNDFVLDRNLPVVEKELLLELFGGKENLKTETLNFSEKTNVKETL